METSRGGVRRKLSTLKFAMKKTCEGNNVEDKKLSQLPSSNKNESPESGEVADQKTSDEKRKEIAEYYDTLKVGAVDRNGNTIFVIYARSNEYVIYSIDERQTIGDIRVTIDSADDDSPVFRYFREIRSEFDSVKSVAHKSSNRVNTARVAHAVSSALIGNPKKSVSLLQNIFKDISLEYKELVVGKLCFIGGTFILALALCSLSLCLYIFEPPLLVSEKRVLYEIILTCAMATLGGFVSVSRGIRSISVDRGMGKWPYILYGIERNVFAIVGGVFIYFLIKSNLILGFIGEMNNEMFALLVFGFLAGFSETLVPNALKTLESQSNQRVNQS